MVSIAKVAGKKRPRLPKLPTGFTETSTTREDGNDAVVTYGLNRGIDPNYAIPMDAINSDLRLEGSPFIRLLGDEFCTASESQINLLAVAPWPIPTGFDLTALVGTGPLTNNNGVTMVQETNDDESPLYEYYVPSFLSSSSQYLSVPTATAVQVGTNSFMASIAFKTTSNNETLFFYGSEVSTKPNWYIFINSSGTLTCSINDGTNSVIAGDPIPNRWLDGRWHIATMLVDRTLNNMYLICDGQLLANVSISAVTGTLTVAGENLYLGALKNSGGSITAFFNGSLALFKLINNAADYNVPQVWNMGTREALSAGTWAVAANSSNRLNNQFSNTSATQGDYSYCTVVTEDGEYEIQVEYDVTATGGIAQLIIDGNVIGTQDTGGSATQNNVVKFRGVKMSAGRHTVKLLSNTKSGGSAYLMQLQWINFIKRKGQEDGGVDNFFLLGDEINERQNQVWSGFVNASPYYNQYFENNNGGSPTNGSYTEGTLFIKGGLYRIDFIYPTNSGNGILDAWFGNVQVLNQLDQYSGSVTWNVVKSVYVRLQQGRQDIRLVVNGKNASSVGYFIDIISIRGVRLSD